MAVSKCEPTISEEMLRAALPLLEHVRRVPGALLVIVAGIAASAWLQPRGVALLLDGRPELAARAGADGAHLPGIEALTAAIGALKPERIAGAGGLKSRHDAMLAAEGGADLDQRRTAVRAGRGGVQMPR